MTVSALRPLACMVAAGHTRHVPEEPYRSVRELVAKLNANGRFAGVDLLPADAVFGREDVLEPWGRFLGAAARDRWDEGTDVKAFTLRLPFAATAVRGPPEPRRNP